MSTLKSDSKGFLIPDSAADIGEFAASIEGVHSDTSAILALVKGNIRADLLRRQKIGSPNAAGSQRNTRFADSVASSVAAGMRARITTSADPRGAFPSVAPARQRDARGRFSSASSQATSELSVVATAVNSLTRAQAAQRAEERRAEASRANPGVDGIDQPRDSRGRFGRGDGSAGHGGTDDAGTGQLSHFKSKFSGSAGDMEKVDPAVEAAKEMSQLTAGPLKVAGSMGKLAMKGLGAGKATPWYQRIWQEIRLGRREDRDADLAELRTLKDIEKKSDGAPRSSGGGMLGGLLSKGGGLLGGLMKGAGGLMKRLPLLGALFAGSSALASIFGSDDPNRSAEENRKDKFTGAGSGIGALIGGGVGMFLGPAGAIVGGIIGDKVGELVGGWLSTADWGAVGKDMSARWDVAVGWFQDKWGTATTKWDEITKSAGAAWGSIVAGAKAFLKDKFGIDIDAITAKAREKIAPVVDAAKEKAAPVLAAIKDGAKAAADYGKQRATKMVEPIGRVAGDAVRGMFGDGSKVVKAAVMRQAATIADPNERAMFMAQMDHESGGFRSLEENLKYKPAQFLKMYGQRAGITTEEQAKAILGKGEGATAEAMYGGDWGKKNLGNTQAGDALAFKGRGVIQLTGRDNYTAAAQATNLDLVNNPGLAADPANAARIAAWYWQSRKGLADAGKAGDVRAATKKINGGLNGIADRDKLFGEYKKMTPEQQSVVIAAGYAPGEEKRPAKPATAGLVVSAAKPAQVVASAVSAAASPASATLPSIAAVTAPAAAPSISVPSICVPTAPSVPPTAQAVIPIPMNSKGPMQVTLANDKAVDQDLRDRRLAMIATGGLAS
ncbi:glycoside hydrolase family 19 protein [Cupriavidus sp. UME77]|uniref:glycoside hydrolase family 19 protein n=1 Tax=Cupriavidus sp. UME77 TaxID=1862321 RepID=UPI0016032B6E|nr:glycoside hydrolase family 19 protein [Cupriavidus sp. UME77]MBB1636076.1 hypothetical protein [Cupriavidus sp. UME77]